MIEGAENYTRTQFIEQIIRLNSTNEYLTSQLAEKDAAIVMLKAELDQIKRLIYGSPLRTLCPAGES